MLSVLLLDLGDTLADDARPFPHAIEAVRTLNRFETADGGRVKVGLVSDFDADSDGPDGVAAAFAEYLELLGGLGFRKLFEPVDQRVTLSAHAGVRKPDARVFQTALSRLGATVSLAECVFVTENADHVAATRALGMASLRYGPEPAPGIDIAGWAEGPLKIARIVAPKSERDLTIALDVELRATRGLGVARAHPSGSEGGVEFDASIRVALDDPALGELSGVEVEIPARGTARLASDGRVLAANAAAPSPEHIRESMAMVRLLRDRGSISVSGAPTRKGATHEIIPAEGGRRLLVRRRYDAG